jgi:2-oxoglutarate dehydrogenase E2 component (dihydrolipoamide succinyltransferase)
MPVKVIMPQLGESVVEGTLTRWLKAQGAAVVENEPLLEVNTDKVDTEIPSPASGILAEVMVPEGVTVRAGSVLAVIAVPGETAVSAALPISVPAPDSESLASPGDKPAASLSKPDASERGIGFLSPVVRKIAAEQQVDLSQVTGSGLGGRITKQDILAYVERRDKETPAVTQPAVKLPTGEPKYPPSADLESVLQPLNAIRRAIAEHMVYSRHTSPHVSTFMEVDLSKVSAHRQAHKEAFAREGVNLTFTAYFIAAAVAALKAYPIVNASWSEEGLLIHRRIHIGMATSLGEAGLIVPVIKDADNLSLLGLARVINDLAARARARTLKPDEVKGGTFTLTNHGISGSLFATPIINQPQCAILGVGAIQKRVVVTEGDAIAIRPMAYLGLTFDHRILDGAVADYFLGAVVESLKNWA